MLYHRPMLTFVGTLCLDRIVAAQRLPVSGEKMSFEDTALAPGGGAGNTAGWAARLGADSQLICALGDDEIGAKCQALARMPGLTVHARAAERTIESLVIIEPHGERSCIYNKSGLIGDLDDGMISIAARSYGTWAELPASRSQDRAQLAAASPRLGIPAQHLETAARENIKVTWSVGSLADGQMPPDELLRSVGCELAILTDGDKGCLVWTGSDWHHVPAQSGVRVIDATGAGDSFLAGVLVALEGGSDVISAAEAGSRAAAACVTQVGGWPR